MAFFVVDLLEAIEVDRQHRHRPWALALQAVEFFGVERAVAQLREHIVLAEEFEVSLGLLACGDVH